jgi:hypothetical protein
MLAPEHIKLNMLRGAPCGVILRIVRVRWLRTDTIAPLAQWQSDPLSRLALSNQRAGGERGRPSVRVRCGAIVYPSLERRASASSVEFLPGGHEGHQGVAHIGEQDIMVTPHTNVA